MDWSKSPESENVVSVKAATNMYPNKIKGSNPSSITQNGFSEMSSSRMREQHVARRNPGHNKENRRAAESVKAKAESEPSSVKKMVKDHALVIEESDSKAKSEMQDIEKLQKTGQQESKGTENYQHEELFRELVLVKQELSRLKLYLAADGEKRTPGSTSTEAVRKGTEEINDEQETVDQTKMEASEGFGEVEAQLPTEAKVSLPKESRRKSTETFEVEKSKENESSSEPLSDVNVMRNELNLMKGKDSRRGRRVENLMPVGVGYSESEESEAPALLEIITEELGKAKSELMIIRKEGFQSSMDVIRKELMHVKNETRRLERIEDKTEATVQNLTAKLQKTKFKLETVSAAEEKAQSLLKKLTLTLEKLYTQRDTSSREVEAVRDEVVTMKAEIRKAESGIDKTEASLRGAMQELEGMRRAEGLALEKLKTLVEKTKRGRYSGDQYNPVVTISKFEYEYLTRYAAGAEDIADKKIIATQAWIEALKASEKEILMKIDSAKKQMNETTMEGETNAPSARNSRFEKQEAERGLKHWKQNCEQEAAKFLQQRSTGGSSRNKGNSTRTERPQPHKSASQDAQSVSSPRNRKY